MPEIKRRLQPASSTPISKRALSQPKPLPMTIWSLAAVSSQARELGKIGRKAKSMSCRTAT